MFTDALDDRSKQFRQVYERTLERALSSIYEILLRDSKLKESKSTEETHRRIRQLVVQVFSSQKDKIIRELSSELQQLKLVSRRKDLEPSDLREVKAHERSELLGLRSEVRVLRQRLEEKDSGLVKDELERTLLQLKEYREQKLQLQSKYERLLEQKRLLQFQVNNANNSLNSKDISEAMYLKSLERKDQTVKAKQAEIDVLIENFQAFKAESEQTISSLQAKLIQQEEEHLQAIQKTREQYLKARQNKTERNSNNQLNLLLKVSDLQKQKIQVSQQLQAAKYDLTRQQSRLKEFEDESDKLKATLTLLETQNQERTQALKRLKTANYQLSFQLQSQNDKVQQQSSKNSKLREQNKLLRQEQVAIITRNEKLQNQRQKINIYAKRLQKELKEASDSLSLSNSQFEKLKLKSREEGEQISILRQKLVLSAEQTNRLSNNLDQSKQNLTLKRTQLFARQQQLNSAKHQIQSLKNELDRKNQRVQEDSALLEQLGLKVTNFQKQTASLKAYQTKLLQEVKTRERQTAILSKEHQLSNQKVTQLVQEKSAIANELSDSNRQVGSLESLLEDQRIKVKDLECQLLIREQLTRNLNLQNQELNEKIDELKKKLTVLRLSVDESKHKNALTKKKLEYILSNITSFKNQVAELQKDVLEYKDGLDIMSHQPKFQSCAAQFIRNTDERYSKIYQKKLHISEKQMSEEKKENIKIVSQQTKGHIQEITLKNGFLKDELLRSNKSVEALNQQITKLQKKFMTINEKGQQLQQQNKILNQQLRLLKEQYKQEKLQVSEQNIRLKLQLQELKQSVPKQTQLLLEEVSQRYQKQIVDLKVQTARIIQQTKSTHFRSPCHSPYHVSRSPLQSFDSEKLYSPRTQIYKPINLPPDSNIMHRRHPVSFFKPTQNGSSVGRLQGRGEGEIQSMSEGGISQAQKIIKSLKRQIRDQREQIEGSRRGQRRAQVR